MVSGGTLTIDVGASGYEIVFNHDNPITALGNPVPGTDNLELHFDVISGDASNGIVKIEMFPTVNPYDGTGQLRIDEWTPVNLTTPGHYSFNTGDLGGAIPVGTVTVTPVIGSNEAGTTLEIDNVWIGKEGTFTEGTRLFPVIGICNLR